MVKEGVSSFVTVSLGHFCCGQRVCGGVHPGLGSRNSNSKRERRRPWIVRCLGRRPATRATQNLGFFSLNFCPNFLEFQEILVCETNGLFLSLGCIVVAVCYCSYCFVKF
jgi:hypothetical protein